SGRQCRQGPAQDKATSYFDGLGALCERRAHPQILGIQRGDLLHRPRPAVLRRPQRRALALLSERSRFLRQWRKAPCTSCAIELQKQGGQKQGGAVAAASRRTEVRACSLTPRAKYRIQRCRPECDIL